MKPYFLSKTLAATAVAAILSYGAGLQAATSSSTVQVLNTAPAGQNEFQPLAFSDSAEALKLHQAYRILATGDHDYAGHRVKAMHAVEAAAKLLGLDLSGDVKDREKQVLSDDKLREASGLISDVLASADVKDQKRVTRHLNAAIKQINLALEHK